MVKDGDITEFFSNIKTIISKNDNNTRRSVTPEPSNNAVCDKPGEQRTNVIYLNTNCNLRCEYCYEISSRDGLPDQIDCTYQDIDSFLEEICIREKNLVSTIVLMGGEPFLRFELIEYTLLKSASLTKKKGAGWCFSIISNGTLFSDKILTEYKELISLVSKNSVRVTQEISFDVSGQYRRKWPNGDNSVAQVEKGMQKLIDYKIPFRISYTVHMGNYNNIIRDCIYILEKYPKDYCERLMVGYAHSDLDSSLGEGSVERIRKDFTQYADHLFEIYGVPICNHTCGGCGICKKSNFVGNSYLSPTKGITYADKKTLHSFKQF